MTAYRNNLPQLDGEVFLTDGGLETTLIFHHGIDLPEFAAFVLLEEKKGQKILHDYFSTYAAIAHNNKVGFILESATWRASADWAEKIGYSKKQLAEFNQRSIQMLEDIKTEFETKHSRFVISGCIGPRGDGYDPSYFMTAGEAEQYHSVQIDVFKDTNADMVSAITMTYVEEAIGVTRAAQKAELPVVISFTVETDGKLPSGQSLKDAIEAVDRATDNGPAYYMINCAHPTHFEHVLSSYEDWPLRIRGLHANASCKSHEELDNSVELDAGNPQELGEQYNALKSKLKNLNIHGGCCGTDHRHIEEICKAVL